ncbi:hypothetical protein NHQ30_003305 [Ciborinia camelliae]|nr:hypothetical protein NHQ30_003305 [Ciborinia camelliae]
MSDNLLSTGTESTPTEATLKVTPAGMEDSASDQESSLDIDTLDSHLHATITYFCRMVFPNDGEKSHTPSSALDDYLKAFGEIFADEEDILPFQHANLAMLELRLREGLEAMQEKKEELEVELEGAGYDCGSLSDDGTGYCRYCGGIEGDECESDKSDDDHYCHCNADGAAILTDGVPLYHHCAVDMENEGPADGEDERFCRCAMYDEGSDDDIDIYCDCT